MRSVTERGGVDLAPLSYHFGFKPGLLAAALDLIASLA